MRKLLGTLGGGAVALAAAAVVVLPAGAGEFNEADTTIVVAKEVVGPATGGFSVEVTCTDGRLTSSATLNFDETGAPTDFTGDGPWMIVDGTWSAVSGGPPAATRCTATETEADGAASTSWTCTDEIVTDNGLGPVGCDAEAGDGTGPVGFSVGPAEGGILSQAYTVVFTNTIPEPEAEPVSASRPDVIEARPAFTG